MNSAENSSASSFVNGGTWIPLGIQLEILIELPYRGRKPAVRPATPKAISIATFAVSDIDVARTGGCGSDEIGTGSGRVTTGEDKAASRSREMIIRGRQHKSGNSQEKCHDSHRGASA
ncbi:MAG: hypothetical protein ACRDQX_01200 [Pseudonocardiaceae bacterium]